MAHHHDICKKCFQNVNSCMCEELHFIGTATTEEWERGKWRCFAYINGLGHSRSGHTSFEAQNDMKRDMRCAGTDPNQYEWKKPVSHLEYRKEKCRH